MGSEGQEVVQNVENEGRVKLFDKYIQPFRAELATTLKWNSLVLHEMFIVLLDISTLF